MYPSIGVHSPPPVGRDDSDKDASSVSIDVIGDSLFEISSSPALDFIKKICPVKPTRNILTSIGVVLSTLTGIPLSRYYRRSFVNIIKWYDLYLDVLIPYAPFIIVVVDAASEVVRNDQQVPQQANTQDSQNSDSNSGDDMENENNNNNNDNSNQNNIGIDAVNDNNINENADLNNEDENSQNNNMNTNNDSNNGDIVPNDVSGNFIDRIINSEIVDDFDDLFHGTIEVDVTEIQLSDDDDDEEEEEYFFGDDI
ncbi:hypothetical protein TRFO_14936 [Tritrichomonas foetus]|uniref:Uncharacterized protein n=1 Tax=Tritrichomonas foetus TaxID=1144522 RepID=A0A1J4KY53_9EUKA|nr:hypothetical protein TRFO_14936 [Tritrichomonas foetus]|eukprot:OHT14636.1 hypothetical protein TRFO_14936 [Tritrichomonas foetus]